MIHGQVVEFRQLMKRRDLPAIVARGMRRDSGCESGPSMRDMFVGAMLIFLIPLLLSNLGLLKQFFAVGGMITPTRFSLPLAVTLTPTSIALFLAIKVEEPPRTPGETDAFDTRSTERLAQTIRFGVL